MLQRSQDSVTLIQRFGSALNLNPRLHILFLYRIAVVPHAGRQALTLYSVPPVDGFSLHAATVCEAYQR